MVHGMLAERLRELRKSAGLTVRELADRIGISSPGYVSRMETRGEIPSAELLCAIANEYHVDPEELLELAKRAQLERAERDITERHASVLSLYRKEKT